MGLRILAQYEHRKSGDICTESLRVDGQGLIPRADPKYAVQITLTEGPGNYRFPVPPEFNRQKHFTIPATELPVPIHYGANVTVSIIEKDRRGEKIIAQSPLRYRTV
ncbi:hypothetical protein [Methanoregula sp.]|uniref:hypothetical protein n=1 Tax=Methanoregula sp. TaxID=2052170 RepID=UPI000CB18B5A|nr:hypothetical protein [Methanoregula sp.]PKG31550.1 MAG: hypothetical protein CW742_12815 [Methanoregula sp.]